MLRTVKSTQLTPSAELTFILLARPARLAPSTHRTLDPTQIAQCRMVGDVNLFLPGGVAEDGECEIMIASESAGDVTEARGARRSEERGVRSRAGEEGEWNSEE